MSDIFKGYEEEYCALSASIGQKTAKVEGLGEAERRPVMKEVEAELTQAASCSSRWRSRCGACPPPSARG